MFCHYRCVVMGKTYTVRQCLCPRLLMLCCSSHRICMHAGGRGGTSSRNQPSRRDALRSPPGPTFRRGSHEKQARTGNANTSRYASSTRSKLRTWLWPRSGLRLHACIRRQQSLLAESFGFKIEILFLLKIRSYPKTPTGNGSECKAILSLMFLFLTIAKNSACEPG